MKLTEKVAIITGAGSGVGWESAILFANEGAKVVAVDINEANCQQVVKKIVDNGGTAEFCTTDLSNAKDVERMVDFTIKKFGRIDIIFNCAGINYFGLIEEFSEEVFDKLINVNLKGPFLCCKNILPIMKKQGSGVIINMGSCAGHIGVPIMGLYAATKAAVINLTKTMAWEVAPQNIRVNSISPGSIDTPMMRETVVYMSKRNGLDPKIVRKENEDGHVFKRWAKPKEIANAALFLASDDASFITGADLPVDGGVIAH